MAWTDPVDIYCERLGPGFWAEPVNAITNLGFVLVGAWFWRSARQARAGTFVEVLCAWVIVIGAGSFLFHTVATRWAALFDVVPIWTFVLTYVFFALRRYLRMTAPRAVGSPVGAVVVIVVVMRLIPESLATATNGSIEYLPAVIALLFFVVVLARAGHPAWRAVGLAGLVFCLSLALRSFDMRVCETMPLGLHWAWHLLNATMLGVLLGAAVAHGGHAAHRQRGVFDGQASSK